MDFDTARAKLIGSLAREITDKRVLSVMARVPRHVFIPPDVQVYAYEDRPLPIGGDQTISQPYIVALMTQYLELTGNEKVLEIGTGSGYQTAILAELARYIVSTERIAALAEKARVVLDILGYGNVEVHTAEETLGWKSGAPYDAIIATAGAPCVPDDLVAQLAVGGRMVIPVGSRDNQELVKVTRLKTGTHVEHLDMCRFVPLIGKGAWE
ncbi:MAG: protein-L-isoaspartate(D-aspartate) O-methyltransferase [Dehalococcoidia bacterium]|nr:protein-L-isoaspartate(D-aspartate) O-methyltransferase [Dehalococcoidia bacterium]